MFCLCYMISCVRSAMLSIKLAKINQNWFRENIFVWHGIEIHKMVWKEVHFVKFLIELDIWHCGITNNTKKYKFDWEFLKIRPLFLWSCNFLHNQFIFTVNTYVDSWRCVFVQYPNVVLRWHCPFWKWATFRYHNERIFHIKL